MHYDLHLPFYLLIFQVILHRKIAIGDPRNAILDVAEKEKADLIVVGSHGYSTLKRS